VDANGKPVAMAYVLADSRSTPATEIPQYLSAWTGSDGKYTMYLPAGEFYIGASTHMPPSPKEELPRFIEVSEDMEGMDIIFRNPPK
jgi:hypothetical protein